MSARDLLLVLREEEFSPGKVVEDRAIIELAGAALERQGFAARTVVTDDFCTIEPSRNYALVLAMCQGQRALGRLAAFEAVGVPTVNSAAAIRSCYRDRMNIVLASVGTPIPYGALLSTRGKPDPDAIGHFDFSPGVYVKRGDLHALSADDVGRVLSVGQLETKLESFAKRSIDVAYVQQGVPGEVVKFYGVSGQDFFRLKDAPQRPDGGRGRSLEAAARRAATALRLEVWGGDAIVSEDDRNGGGNAAGFQIIDFNDWPSFSSVLEEAAMAIARRCLDLLGASSRSSYAG